MIRILRSFILAAGYGERLQPITNYIPKPLLPILGKPLLESIVEKILAFSCDTTRLCSIGINLRHKKEMLEEWVNGSPFRDVITLFPEEQILGTGGALKNAECFLSEGDFIVHNGDIISDLNLAGLVEYHFKSNNLVTLAVHDHPQFRNVAIDDNGFLRGVGKAYLTDNPAERKVAFTGIAVYSAAFLKFLPPGASSVVDAWIEAAGSGYRVGTFDVAGCSWSDIGSPASYASALARELKKQGETVHFASATSGCSSAEFDGTIVVERDCTIGNESSLKNCILLPGSRTGKGSVINNCIMGPDYIIPVAESVFVTATYRGMLVGTGGSDRKYYRVPHLEGTAIMMECSPDDPDFSRHIAYTRFFAKYGIPVPVLISAYPEARSALFEDLGDFSLYAWLKCPRSNEEIETIYRHVLDILVRLHCEASEHVSECPMLAKRIFDYAYLRWETQYFSDRFVKGLRQLSIDGAGPLEDEFHRLALKVDTYPKRIIHRDFQSQNIMMAKGAVPRVIDYQGARMAPPAYDIASVLFDPYAPLEEGVRQSLIAYYVGEMRSGAGDWFVEREFTASLPYCRLQRHMQALGAYGFLSEVKGKIYFLKHVPECLRLLKEEVSLARDEFPVLYDLIARL